MVSRSRHPTRDRRSPAEHSHMCVPDSLPMHSSVLPTELFQFPVPSLWYRRTLLLLFAFPLTHACSRVLCWRPRHFLLDAPSRSLAVTDASDGFVDNGGDWSSWTTRGPLGGDPPGPSVTRVRLNSYMWSSRAFVEVGRPVNCAT